MSQPMENDDSVKDTSKLSKLIDDTVSIVQIQVGEHAINREIEMKVKDVVKEVLLYTKKKDFRFKSSEIISVGSYKEKTKILATDEFDFLVVIDELSKPGAISIVKDDAPPGFAYIEVNDKKLTAKWWCVDKRLRQFQYPSKFSNVPKSFSETMLASISEIAKRQNVKLYIDNNCILRVETKEKTDRTGVTFKSVGDTFLHQASIQTPNFILSLVVNGHPVTVDICPAIRYNNVKEVYSMRDCDYPELADRVFKKGSILFVNQYFDGFSSLKQGLFKITFTETEVDFVHNMTKHHKNIYMFLKLLNRHFQSLLYNPFPSYVLKIACIQHSLTCESITIAVCLKHIVEILSLYTKNNFISSPFIKTYNIQKRAILEINENILSILKDMTSDSTDITCFNRSDIDKLQSNKQLMSLYGMERQYKHRHVDPTEKCVFCKKNHLNITPDADIHVQLAASTFP
ncbi:unnamed protein product [Mytilus coruscus]|uniref:Mab-21-like nucleotidyltransferase domain-containing protein n=1 Tax=Mytilus coruscus TaxID=42192 RepID=A0A6J8ESA5_MYTCO|nr:unnamed protein product [Mytilus coruscus]